jgi:hypothetical protein
MCDLISTGTGKLRSLGVISNFGKKGVILAYEIHARGGASRYSG